MKGGLYYIPQNQAYGIRVDKVFYQGKSKFQKIFVGHSPLLGRFLAIDGSIQSSELDAHIYHEAIVHPALMSLANPKNVLILGGGEGTTAKEVLKHADVHVDMVEIDSEVVRLSKKFLPYALKKKNKNFNLMIGDAFKFIKETKKKYDLIISDLTDVYGGGSVSLHLFNEKFARMVKSKLTAQGIYVTLACGFRKNREPAYMLKPEYLQRTFKIIKPFSFYMPAYKIQMFFVASSMKTDPTKTTSKEIVSKMKSTNKKFKFYNDKTHHALFTNSYDALIKDADMF